MDTKRNIMSRRQKCTKKIIPILRQHINYLWSRWTVSHHFIEEDKDSKIYDVVAPANSKSYVSGLPGK